jgi:hypothetical protein
MFLSPGLKQLLSVQFEMQKREQQLKAYRSQVLRKQLYERKLSTHRKFLDSIRKHA